MSSSYNCKKHSNCCVPIIFFRDIWNYITYILLEIICVVCISRGKKGKMIWIFWYVAQMSPFVLCVAKNTGVIVKCSKPRTTDTRRLNLKFFAAQIQIPLPNASKNFSPKCLLKPKFQDFWKKALWMSVVCGLFQWFEI